MKLEFNVKKTSAVFNGQKYIFDTIKNHGHKGYREYEGKHYCFYWNGKEDLVLSRRNQGFKRYNKEFIADFVFDTLEETIAALEEALGIVKVCTCENQILMLRGCQCGAFLQEKKKVLR